VTPTIWIYVPAQAQLGADFDALGKATRHGWRSVVGHPVQMYEIELEPLEYMSVAAVRTALATARVGGEVLVSRASEPAQPSPRPRDPHYGNIPLPG
jgi:hypothetical protein